MKNKTSTPVTEKIKSTAEDVVDAAKEHQCEMCDKVTGKIRQNPIAAVVGAAVFGAAVCYLIMEGRREASFKERLLHGSLADASNNVSSSLRSAADHLKFW